MMLQRVNYSTNEGKKSIHARIFKNSNVNVRRNNGKANPVLSPQANFKWAELFIIKFCLSGV